MSVRRVSDLPSVENPESERLRKSFLEVSYLRDDSSETGQKYVSNKFSVGEFVEQAALMGWVSPSVSGDVNINTGSTPGNTYKCNLNFGYGVNVSANISCLSGMSVAQDISCNAIWTTNDKPYSEISCGENCSSGDYSRFVLNFLQVSAFVQEQIRLAKSEMSAKVNPIPFLTMIYSDHPIADSNWLSGGSTLDLTAYPLLSAALPGISASLPRNSNSPYHYVINDNRLTLPSCDRYVRCVSDPLSVGTVLSSSAPNISGVFGQLPSSSQTQATGAFHKLEKKKLGPNDGTSGNKDWTISFNASRSSRTYGRLSGDSSLSGQIIPETVCMIPYYYVGGGVS